MSRFQNNRNPPSEKQLTIPLAYVTIADIDLTVAHVDVEYGLPGIFDTLVVESLVGSLSIKLNKTSSGAINLTQGRVVNLFNGFDKIFLTNTAQPGASIVLQVGAEASFGVPIAGVRPATFPTAPMPIGNVASQATVAAYAALGTVNYCQTIDKSTWVLRETGGVNGALYQVQASMDNVNFVTLKTDVPLVASGIAYETLDSLWPYVLFNIKDAIAASHATVAGLWYYKSLK